jgi:hypothetical protein
MQSASVADVQPIQALYYPHRLFASAAWVKSLLFFWEGVFRFRKEGMELVGSDEPEVRELVAAGLVRELDVTDLVEDGIEIVGARLEQLAREGGGLLPPCIREIEELRGISASYLARGRQRMARHFQERGWHLAARAVVEQPHQTSALHSAVFNAVIRRHHHLAPVTEDPIFDAACTYFGQGVLTEQPKDEASGSGLAASQLFVPMPSMEAVAALSVDQLMPIRDQLASARRRFREKVQARIRAIADLPSEYAAREHLRHLAAELRDELEESREVMRHARLQERWALLGVSAPASVSVGMALAGQAIGVAGPLGGVASAVLAVSNWYFQHRRPQHEPSGNYLLSVERAAEGAHGHHLSRAMRRLFKH